MPRALKRFYVLVAIAEVVVSANSCAVLHYFPARALAWRPPAAAAALSGGSREGHCSVLWLSREGFCEARLLVVGIAEPSVIADLAELLT